MERCSTKTGHVFTNKYYTSPRQTLEHYFDASVTEKNVSKDWHLDPVVDQFGHDLRLELLELRLVDGVSLGDDGDDVHLHNNNRIGGGIVAET